MLLLAAALFGMARLGVSQGQQAIPKAVPDSAQAHLGRGYEDLRNDRYEDAAREFRAALVINPRLLMQARLPLGIVLFQMDQYEAARTEFAAVRAAIGDHPDVMYYLGRVDFIEGHFDQAIRELTAAAKHPPFPDTWYYLGAACQKKGESAEAEHWLSKAAALDPADARVQDSLALVYQSEGNTEGAETAFALARQLRRRELARTQMAVECDQALKTKALDEARAVCQKIFDPRDYERLTTLGTLYGQHGDYADAIEPFRRAADLEPASPQAEYNYALACYGLKQYRQARAALERVVKAWPDLYNLSALLGAALFQLDDELPAYQSLRHAHQLDPENPQTAELLYKVEIKLAQKSANAKRYVRAVRYLKQAALLYPDEPGPHLALAEVYSLMGEPAQAAKERRESQRLSRRDSSARK